MNIVDSRAKTDSQIEVKWTEATGYRHIELLGRKFRIVDSGLDPDEVVEFLKAATGSSEDAFQRLEQFSALQAAAMTMQESIAQAKRLAEHARKQAETEARQKKAQAAMEAGQQAAVIIEQARASCVASVDSTRAVLLNVVRGALEKAKDTLSSNLVQIREDIEKTAEEHRSQWPTVTEQSAKRPSSPKIEPADSVSISESAEEVALEEAVPSLVHLHEGRTGLHKSGSSSERMPGGEPATGWPAAPDSVSGALVEAADGLYSGSVAVIIPRGVKETWMHQFRKRISQVSGVHIQGEAERDQERLEVTLSLDKPTKLLPLLQELPNVRKVMEDWNAGKAPEAWGPGRANRVSKKSEEVALILQFA